MAAAGYEKPISPVADKPQRAASFERLIEETHPN
jgi:hypothetical protein